VLKPGLLYELYITSKPTFLPTFAVIVLVFVNNNSELKLVFVNNNSELKLPCVLPSNPNLKLTLLRETSCAFSR
jgi:hypothetical protein